MVSFFISIICYRIIVAVQFKYALKSKVTTLPSQYDFYTHNVWYRYSLYWTFG